MTRKIIVALLGIVLTLPMLSFSAHAENTWTIFVSPYEENEKKELFQPRELPIFSGDKVTWQNNDSVTHKIVSGVPQHPDYSGEFFSTDSISVGENISISLDFDVYAGYYYFCEIHPWFTGKIFFEDRPDILHSTIETSYEIQDNDMLLIEGLVEPDLGNTEYEILIFDSKNNLVFQKGDSFEQDASFKLVTDISNSEWKKDRNYIAKLVYGVPSESTSIPLQIPIKDTYERSKYLEFCKNSKSESSFLFDEIHLPNWYRKALCWYGNEIMTEKELSDSLNFFKESLK